MKTLLRVLLVLFGLIMAPSARSGPLIVILLPDTGLRDWRKADAPCLHRLMETGALAVMNTRTARLPNDRNRETEESAALTLGAGSRAASVSGARAFSQPNVSLSGLLLTAGEAYTRRMGTLPPKNTDVNPSWPALLKANQRRGYDIRLGNLAGTLADNGITMRAGGGPLSALVAAANNGTVTITSALQARENECLVWDAGSDLHAADGVLRKAATVTTATGGTLIALSPCASDTDYAIGRRLTPVLEWGAGVPAGLLSSPSTRRLGLVADTDFATTVAAHFGISKWATAPFGRAWAGSPSSQTVRRVSALEEQSYRQARGMRLLPYLAVFLALWMGIGTALALNHRMPALWPLLPPALLLALLGSTISATVAPLVAVSVLAAAISLRFIGSGPTLLALLTAIATTLTVDMTTGGWLMQRSLLGYSAVEGARYYGIGNEAMGPLIASLLVVTARLWRVKKPMRVLLILILALVALLLGSPLAGAKAGGLLVSLMAFGTLLFSLSGRRWSPPVVGALMLSVILLTAAVAIADAFWQGHTHSHVGEAIQRASAGGVGELGDVISRKLSVEGRLAYHSAWALPLWGGLGCWLMLWRRHCGVMAEEKALRVAGSVAIGASLLLNDAGVIATALCVVILWCEAVSFKTEKKPLEAVRLPGAFGWPNDY